MTLFDYVPTFLFPTSRQFAFDEAVEKLVRALERRNWQVPGVEVIFDTYGSGYEKYTYVRTLRAKEWKIYFGRRQGRLNERLYNIAAAKELCFKKEYLDVFCDGSGSDLYIYVGDDWEADREGFMNDYKFNSKLHGKKRTYLTYRKRYGNNDGFMVHDNDLGREYDPIGDEPRLFVKQKKFEEFAERIEKTISEITKIPEAKDYNPQAYFTLVKPIPFSEVKHPLGEAYTRCSLDKAEIIKSWNKGESLKPYEQFFFSNGRCLMTHVIGGLEISEEAYDFFIWAAGLTKDDRGGDDIDIPWYWGKGEYFVRLKPKYANDIYVADSYVYLKAREEMFETIRPRIRLTDDEVYYIESVRARTLVPILKYDGSYKMPFMLIRRELNLDEVELVDGLLATSNW